MIFNAKKKSKSFTPEVWVPSRFFPKRKAAENSLSEPLTDIFMNHFNTVGFCTDYWY
jgi:hypothetical protein